jgi:hypothetical protein
MRRSNWIYHPATGLIGSALAVIGYAAVMRWRFPGGDLSNHFIYVLPIIVPFISFLFDRARRISDVSWFEFLIDAAVVTVSIMRMLGQVPYISGHALFLSYAIARPGSRLTRVMAALVMLQVLYLKLFVWHDMITPATGTALGLAAAMILLFKRGSWERGTVLWSAATGRRFPKR